jgi:tRNA dimethylallyltransferase
VSAAAPAPPSVIAIFGPTGVGKTSIAIELAELLRERGEDPVAVSCDAIQVYRGLELLSGAPDAGQRARLEHRLVGTVDPAEEFSAGRFAELARAEIDDLLEAGRRPIVVGGTGLYMRAALAELDLRPPVAKEVRDLVEAQIAELGPAAMHAELDPDVGERVHPNDRKRVSRALELQRAGLDPPERSSELWTARLRHPTALIGIVVGRDELADRIDLRVDEMVSAGAIEEAKRVYASDPSRTARSALGLDELITGDIDGVKSAHRRYARRQMTWLRKMGGVEVVDRSGLSERVAAEAALALVARDTPPV